MDHVPQKSYVVTGSGAIGQYSAEEKFRIIAETSHEWEYWQCPDGHFEYCSPSCECISGYPAEAFYDDPGLFMRIVHPEDRHLLESYHCSTPEKPSEEIEFRITRKDGRPRWIAHTCFEITDPEHHLIGYRATNRDITEMKETQAELERRTSAAEERSLMLDSIIRYAPVGIIVAEADGEIRLVSTVGCELMGLSSEEMTRSFMKYQFYRHQNGMPAASEELPLVRTIRGGERVMNEEWLIEKPNGTRLWVLTNSEPIRDDHDRVIGAILIWQDITDRKAYEQELVRNRSQLTELKDQLLEKNKEMESLISVISHDLRSPLVSVTGFSREVALSCRDLQEVFTETDLSHEQEKMADQILNESIPEYLGYIEASAGAMDRLVRALTKVTRAGLTRSHPEQVDMNELMAAAVASLAFEIRRSGTDIQVDALPPCYADRTEIGQVFTNLLDNAIKYLDPERPGRIRIFGRVRDGRSEYCVEDNGIGIEPRHHGAIFDLFSRIHDYQSAGEGIGLAVVKRLIDKNDGMIGLDSVPGRGSRFCITLPQ